MELFVDKTAGEMLSFLTSLALTVFAFWGVFAFWPNRARREDTAAGWLILAIWIGFLGNGLNALYWRVFGDLAIHYGWMELSQLRAVGNSIGDLIWKGCAAVSIYLHFYARWKAVPDDEKPFWNPLLMGLYPNDEHWVYVLHSKLKLVTKRTKDNDKAV